LFASRDCPIYAVAFLEWRKLNEAQKASSSASAAENRSGGGASSGRGRPPSKRPSEEFLDKMLNSNPASRANWRHGGNIRTSTIEKMMASIEREWPLRDAADRPYFVRGGDIRPVAPILAAIQDDEVSFEAFATLVGLSKDEASMIVDRDYFTDAPLLTDMYYRKRTQAEAKRKSAIVDTDFKELQGYYIATLERDTVLGRIEMDLKIHVKYIFDYRGKHLIRTKLKIPYYVDKVGAPIEEGAQQKRHSAVYDGWVRVIPKAEDPEEDGEAEVDLDGQAAGAGDHIVWVFQKRKDRGKVDFEFMITGFEAGQMELKGRFLTLDQEGSITGGDIVLKHKSRDATDPAFMDEVEWRLIRPKNASFG